MLILHDKALERTLERIGVRTGETQSEIIDRVVREFCARNKWLTKARRAHAAAPAKPPMFGERLRSGTERHP